MNPVSLDIDEGGHKWLGFAKKKLGQLHQLAEITGNPYQQKKLEFDGNRIYVATGMGQDRIRIKTAQPAYVTVWFDYTDTNQYLTITTDINGKQVYRTLLPTGLIPFGIVISGDGHTHFVACADTQGSTTSPVEFTLIVAAYGQVTKMASVTVVPDSGWTLSIQPEVITTFGVYRDISGRPYNVFSANGGTCLFVGARLYKDGLAGLYGDGVPAGGGSNYTRFVKAIVFWFDGVVLSYQTTQWAPTKPPIISPGPISGVYTFDQFVVTCAPDCSFWAAAINNFIREGNETLYVEKHDTRTGDIQVFTAGISYTTAAEYSSGRYGDVSQGFCSSSGVVRSQIEQGVPLGGGVSQIDQYIFHDAGVVRSYTVTGIPGFVPLDSIVRKVESSSGAEFVFSRAGSGILEMYTGGVYVPYTDTSLVSGIIVVDSLLSDGRALIDGAYISPSTLKVPLSFYGGYGTLDPNSNNVFPTGKLDTVAYGYTFWTASTDEDLGMVTGFTSGSKFVLNPSYISLTGLSGPTRTPNDQEYLYDSIFNRGAAF